MFQLPNMNHASDISGHFARQHPFALASSVSSVIRYVLPIARCLFFSYPPHEMHILLSLLVEMIPDDVLLLREMHWRQRGGIILFNMRRFEDDVACRQTKASFAELIKNCALYLIFDGHIVF